MQVRRVAHDLRDLANKALSLRAAAEDFRHDLVRSERHAPWMSDEDLRSLQQRVFELWGAMDRLEHELRVTAAARPSRSLGILGYYE